MYNWAPLWIFPKLKCRGAVSFLIHMMWTTRLKTIKNFVKPKVIRVRLDFGLE
jgi:hypothetical protein